MPNKLLAKIKRQLFRKKIKEFTTSPEYWEKRYRLGGTSGKGSYGDEAQYKADFITRFLAEHSINNIIDFGCGDGNNLSLIEYPNYLGIDVSNTAVKTCSKLFEKKPNYSFFWDDTKDSRPLLEKLHAANISRDFDLAQSLDVIYHLVEDEIFGRYMADLFGASRQHVLIYSTDHEEPARAHVRYRCISDYVTTTFPDYTLVATFPNPCHGGDKKLQHFLHFKRS